MNKHRLTPVERAVAWERVRTAQRIQADEVYEAHVAAKRAAVTARVLRSRRGTLHLAHPTGARLTLCNRPIETGRSPNVAGHPAWPTPEVRWDQGGKDRCTSCLARA
jgi:hypothetical protein